MKPVGGEPGVIDQVCTQIHDIYMSTNDPEYTRPEIDQIRMQRVESNSGKGAL